MGDASTTDHPDAVDFVAKYENDLAHYGIPGMKWGVRRDQATLDRLAGRTTKKKLDSEYKKQLEKVGDKVTARSRAYRKLSREDLRKTGGARPEFADRKDNMPDPKKPRKRGKDGLYGYSDIPKEKTKTYMGLTKDQISLEVDARVGENELKGDAKKAERALNAWRLYEYDRVGAPNDVKDDKHKGRVNPTGFRPYEEAKKYKRVRRLSAKHSDILLSDIEVPSEDFLAHYGIPGMKWGVRRSQETLDRLAGRTPKKRKKSDREKDREKIKKTKRKAKTEVEEARIKGKAEIEKAKIEKKVTKAKTDASEPDRTRKTSTKVSNPKDLTDAELSDVIKRLEMEKRYATLVKESKPKTAGDAVKSFVGKEVKKHASQFASKLIDQQVKKIVGESTYKVGETIINEASKPKAERITQKPPPKPRERRKKKATPPPPREQPTKTYYQTATRLDTLKEIERRRRG